MPFLFRVNDENDKALFYKVKICKKFWDYKEYSSGWMDDKDLGNSCLIPDVDLTDEQHIFATETEALKFIRSWWIANAVQE